MQWSLLVWPTLPLLGALMNKDYKVTAWICDEPEGADEKHLQAEIDSATKHSGLSVYIESVDDATDTEE